MKRLSVVFVFLIIHCVENIWARYTRVTLEFDCGPGGNLLIFLILLSLELYAYYIRDSSYPLDSYPQVPLPDGQTNNFRKDYTFIEATNSYYKFHTIPKPWIEAKKSCAMEGTTLFYPRDEIEANAVIQFWNETQPTYYIFLGVSALITRGVFETIDGIPVNDVYSKWNRGEPNDVGGKEDCIVMGRHNGGINDDECTKKFPYICKKAKADIMWNTPCGLPDMQYKYSESMGKCYKFHLAAKNWTDAHAVCRSEQSYLAIINSQAEAKFLEDVTNKAEKDKSIGLDKSGAVFLGFHNRFENEGWVTITGQTLESSGYSKWSYGQPDGKGTEKCGSMFYHGELNDMPCHLRCFFICEHDINLLEKSFDERLGNAV